MLWSIHKTALSAMKIVLVSTGLSLLVVAQITAEELDTRPVVHRINCGGSALEDNNIGRTWAADYGYGNSSTIHRAHGAIEGVPLQSWEDFQLYEQQRYATRAQRSLVYQLPVPWPGDYQVELYFAETCPCASEPGQRVFDVELEGKLAATIDVVSEAGFLRTHSVHLSSHVTDGSLTLEMLGLIRNPILSAIEVIGPIDFVANGQTDGARYRSPTMAPSQILDPPKRTTLETNGKTFELAHASTGQLHRLDLRFETAYDSDPNVRVFRVDVPQSETSFSTFEEECIDKCTKTNDCVGVFVRSLQTTYHCNGLSSFGRPVGTQSVSRSWKLRGAVPKNFGTEAFHNRPDLVSAVLDAKTTRSTTVVFEGRTATNPSGPWLTFSTQFQRFHHVFALPLSPESCMNHCNTIATCAGVIIWEDPESTNEIMCLGVNEIGTKSGIETDLNCVSIMMAPTSKDGLSLGGGGFPGDDFFGTILLAESSKLVSGGAIAGIVCGVLLSVCVGLLVRWNVKYGSANDDGPSPKDFLWDSNGIMWARPKMERRGGGFLQFPQPGKASSNPNLLTKRPSMASVLHTNDQKSAGNATSQPLDLHAMGKKASSVFNLLSLSQNLDGSKNVKNVPHLQRRTGGLIDTTIIDKAEMQEYSVPTESEGSNNDAKQSYRLPAIRLPFLNKMQLSIVVEDDSLEEGEEPQPQLFAPPKIASQLTPYTQFEVKNVGLEDESEM